MNFPDVRNWTIPEGSVKRVLDSQDRVIWECDYYDLMDYITVPTNKQAGIIVPINIPKNASYEIMMSFDKPNTTVNKLSMFMGMKTFGCGRWYGRTSNSSNARTNWIQTVDADDFPSTVQYPSTNRNVTNTVRSTVTLGPGLYNSNYNGKTAWYGYSSYQNDNVEYKGTNYSSNLLNTSTINSYWGFGVIATGRNTYYTTYQNETFGTVSYAQHWYGNIYGCYIKVNGNYVYNFVPAQRHKTGEYGLWDTINRQFYTSCTGNAFTHTTVQMQSVTLTNTTTYIGEATRIPRSITPSTTTNKTFTWTSNNTSIATVNSSGYVTGVSTAVGNNRPTITAVAKDGSGVTGTCRVTVLQFPTNVTLSTNNITLKPGDIEYIQIYIAPDSNTVGRDYIKINTTYDMDVSVINHYDYGYCIKIDVDDTAENATHNLNFQWSDGTSWHTIPVTVKVNDNVIAVTGVSLNTTTATIGSGGGQTTLTATVRPSNATNKNVSWVSSDTSVATVDSNGVVTGVEPGTATITATAGEYSATCTVTVQPIAVTGIVLDSHSVTVGQNDVVTLTATISPSNASNTDINIQVSGASTHVSSTVHNGNVWTIKWKADASSGQAQITVTTIDGSYSDTCTMNIISVTPVTGVTLNNHSLSLNTGNTSQLTATVTPSNATNKSVSWVSSNTSVATVNSNGLVTAVGNGTATITVTTSSGSYTDDCNVTVTTLVSNITLNQHNLTVTYGITSSYQLLATINPNTASNKNVTWSTSNSNVASVNTSGKVTFNSLGTVTIRCTANDGSGKYDECVFTVIPNFSISPLSFTPTAINTTHNVRVSSSPSVSDMCYWSSSNTSVATVNKTTSHTFGNPDQAVVTIVGYGNADIIWHNTTRNVTRTCNVTFSAPTKYLQIINNSTAPIYYHQEDLGDQTLAVGATTSVTLTQGDSLYIRNTDRNSQPVAINCYSVSTLSSGYYKITYAKAEDGDSITVTLS